MRLCAVGLACVDIVNVYVRVRQATLVVCVCTFGVSYVVHGIDALRGNLVLSAWRRTRRRTPRSGSRRRSRREVATPPTRSSLQRSWVRSAAGLASWQTPVSMRTLRMFGTGEGGAGGGLTLGHAFVKLVSLHTRPPVATHLCNVGRPGSFAMISQRRASTCRPLCSRQGGTVLAALCRGDVNLNVP